MFFHGPFLTDHAARSIGREARIVPPNGPKAGPLRVIRKGTISQPVDHAVREWCRPAAAFVPPVGDGRRDDRERGSSAEWPQGEHGSLITVGPVDPLSNGVPRGRHGARSPASRASGSVEGRTFSYPSVERDRRAPVRRSRGAGCRSRRPRPNLPSSPGAPRRTPPTRPRSS